MPISSSPSLKLLVFECFNASSFHVDPIASGVIQVQSSFFLRRVNAYWNLRFLTLLYLENAT
uniref:Uncharacterized protein n=1 Tax=Anguilla anguilla TaxID=7936 RepID=A0A0E9UV61_ANGAN